MSSLLAKLEASNALRRVPKLHDEFRFAVSAWFHVSRTLRLSTEVEPEAPQKVLCSELIAFGESAGTFAIQDSIDLSPVGITVEAIQAETRLLRDHYILLDRHNPKALMTLAEADTLLSRIFGDAAKPA